MLCHTTYMILMYSLNICCCYCWVLSGSAQGALWFYTHLCCNSASLVLFCLWFRQVDGEPVTIRCPEKPTVQAYKAPPGVVLKPFTLSDSPPSGVGLNSSAGAMAAADSAMLDPPQRRRLGQSRAMLDPQLGQSRAMLDPQLGQSLSDPPQGRQLGQSLFNHYNRNHGNDRAWFFSVKYLRSKGFDFEVRLGCCWLADYSPLLPYPSLSSTAMPILIGFTHCSHLLLWAIPF